MTDTENAFIYDAANELIVIGAAITDGKLRRELVHRLSSDEFLVPVHAPIWRALRSMADSGLDYTPEAARRLVLDEGGDEEAVDYLESLDARVPENLEWHLNTLEWDATRCRILKGSVPELLRILKDPKATSADVVTSARAVTRGLEGGGRRHMHRPAELHRQYRSEIAARRARRNVYPLGANAFDKNLTEGFMPGRTTVSAGLPGAGKSTVWLAFAIMLAKLGRRPMYCAWEMEAESLLDVSVAHLTRIELRRIVQGDLSDEEAARIEKATRWVLKKVRFMGNPFFGKSSRGKPSNERNLDLLEGYIAESGCDVIIYDLWERCLAWRKPDDVAGALYRMQAMHTEYGVHGVVVQQLLLKDVEKRADKRPTRESIKGSGAYVEVADLIFGIHREGQFKNIEDETVETICLKQRKGKPNWSIRWKWNGSTCYLGEPSEVSYDPGLENAAGDGDISDTDSINSKKSGKNSTRVRKPQKIGRRE